MRTLAQLALLLTAFAVAPSPPVRHHTATKRVFTRAEVDAVTGRPVQDVVQLLGPPDAIDWADASLTTWKYHGRTRHPESGEVDTAVLITFRAGNNAVAAVSYGK